MKTKIKLPEKAVALLQKSGYKLAEFPLLCAAPLVRLAWAEGFVQKAERKAVLRVAANLGINSRHEHYGDLLEWLDERPSDAFFDEAGEVLCRTLALLSPNESDRVRQILETGCEAVAEAAPDVGFFRYRSPVTPEEMAEISRFNDSLGLRAGALI